MEGDARERAMTLALLALRADGAAGAERSSHLEVLRQLQVSFPRSTAAAALETQRFERFVRAPQKESAVGERRAQLRAKCRDRWRASGAQSVEPEVARKHLPALFRAEPPAAEVIEQEFPDARSHGQLPAEKDSSEMMEVDTGFEPWSASQEEVEVPAIQPARRPPPAPVAPPAPTAQSAPALGSLFRKKTALPHEMLDDYEDASTGFYSTPQIPSRASSGPAFPEPAGAHNQAQRAPPSSNPFQTAGEKLQHDRLTGRTKDMDDDRGGRGRSLAGREPATRGGYHPINPKVLLGGKRGHGYDDDDNDYRNDGHLAGRVSSAVNKKFVSPTMDGTGGGGAGGGKKTQEKEPPVDDPDIDPRLKSCDPDLIAKIEMEIVDYGDPVAFDDIAGLQFAKKCVNELVIWPMARPDIFTGLRALPKGLLLFGPPGTGKTLIGKAIANQSGATFFSISASSLTSKWIGEGEKLVRTLFAVAAVKQPSVIFIDEIDSLLTQRSSEENEASRRMKTEFLVQLDGAGTKAKDVILVVGATNRPQELDEAARRRFVKRLYIPLPSFEARLDLVNRLLKNNRHDLTSENLKFVADSTKGYSGADVRALCTEAAMGPIRSCPDIRTMDADDVRPIKLEDFVAALRGVRSSVAAKDLDFYREWNDEFGSFPFESHEED